MATITASLDISQQSVKLLFADGKKTRRQRKLNHFFHFLSKTIYVMSRLTIRTKTFLSATPAATSWQLKLPKKIPRHNIPSPVETCPPSVSWPPPQSAIREASRFSHSLLNGVGATEAENANKTVSQHLKCTHYKRVNNHKLHVVRYGGWKR